MKFLVDAHLPPALATFLNVQGFDALHAAALPGGYETPDAEIIRYAVAQQRVILTKDSDLFEGYFRTQESFQLVLLKTGNSSNAGLMALFERNLPALLEALQQYTLMSLEDGKVEVYF